MRTAYTLKHTYTHIQLENIFEVFISYSFWAIGGVFFDIIFKKKFVWDFQLFFVNWISIEFRLSLTNLCLYHFDSFFSLFLIQLLTSLSVCMITKYNSSFNLIDQLNFCIFSTPLNWLVFSVFIH